MIQINTLCDYINNSLNANLDPNSNIVFEIYPESGNYQPPKRATEDWNKIIDKVQGTVEIYDSSIVPASNGLRVATISVLVNFAVKIYKNKGVEESVAEARGAVSQFMSTAKNDVMTETANGREISYSVAIYGTQPDVGERLQHPQLGDSLTYSFMINFSFVENGMNSMNETLTYVINKEVDGVIVSTSTAIPFTEMTINRIPVADGSAFSNTDGKSKTWHDASILEIHLSLPALKDNAFVEAFLNYLLFNTEEVFSIFYENTSTGVGGTFDMIFSQSNMTARGVENVGLNITLVEALEESDAFAEGDDV